MDEELRYPDAQAEQLSDAQMQAEVQAEREGMAAEREDTAEEREAIADERENVEEE